MRKANGFALNNNDNSLFISIHHNANPRSTTVNGTETYYYNFNKYQSGYSYDPLQEKYLSDNKRFADSVHNKLVNNLGTVNRGVHDDNSFYVIRNAQMPSVLLELGYMTNRNEESRIKTSSFQLNAANAIANAVTEYFQVFEVYDENHNRLGLFKTLNEATNFANQQTKLIQIFDKNAQKYVYTNSRYSVVHKTNGYLKEFYYLSQAQQYAQASGETRVIYKPSNWTVWSNYITKKYSVYQGDVKKSDFYDYDQALDQAQKLSNSKIVRNDTNEVLWTNASDVTVNRTVNVKELSGSYRIKTSIETSKQLYPNGFAEDKQQKTVILATGYDFADALSAGPLSAIYDQAPILLTEKDALDENLKIELARLKANKVMIIGGPAAISLNVENQLKQSGLIIERIAGNSRYETNRKILSKLGNTNGYFVASGSQFADALSVTPIAVSQNRGILLTESGKIEDASLNILKGKSVQIIGGTAVVQPTVETRIKGVTNNVERLAGSNRYETLAKVLWKYEGTFNTSTVLVTTGENYPDALAAAPLAVNNPVPLILLDQSIKANVESYLFIHGEKRKITDVMVIGGTLNKSLVTEVANTLK